MTVYVKKIQKFSDPLVDRQIDELVRHTNSTLDALTAHEALTEAHGATGAVVGTTNVQTLTDKTLSSLDTLTTLDVTNTGIHGIGLAYFGDGTNNTVVEADGTLRMDGTATTTLDVQFNMTPLAIGAGHPTLVTWNTDFEEWSYGVGDHANGQGQEVPHSWKEGSALSFHAHISTGSGNYVSGDKIAFTLHVTAADAATSAPFTAFSAASVLTAELAFNSTVAPFSHILLPFSAYSLPAGLSKIGAQIKVKLTRVAKSAGGTDPGTPPFILQVGCHAENDTLGSRGVYTK